MLYYTLTNRPHSLWAHLQSKASEVLSEEAECVQIQLDTPSLSSTKLESLFYHSTYLSLLYPAKSFSAELKKKKRTKRKKGGKNRKEKSYLTNLQRLSPDNWAWNEASCFLFAKVMHVSWLGIRQGAGVQCRVSGFPQSWLLQSHFKENAFLVECLIIFAAKGMTAKITNSEKNPRKTSLLQPRWFCSH